MSVRVDSSSLISGAVVVGDRGLGVLGSEVPSSGTSGPGFIYPDLSLPADANKEFRGFIETWPSDGDLFAYEDTSFLFENAADGTYTFTYRLFEDGVDKGTAVVTLQVGVTAAPGATLTATASLLAGAATGGALAAGQTLTATASILAGSATGASSGTAAGALLAAQASILPGAASAGGSATAPGQTVAAAAQLVAGSAAGEVNGTAAGFLVASTASFTPGAASAGTAAPGALLVAASSLLPGSASGVADSTAPGALFTVGVNILAGGAFGPIFAATKGYTAKLRLRRYSAARNAS